MGSDTAGAGQAWDADVAVIGLGAWGSAALWRLAGRGVDVIGVERYGLGHALGSSHGGSRMFRITCLEHPGLVPVARRSLRLWRELEEQSDTPLLRQVGGLLIGRPDGPIAGGTVSAARRHGIEVEIFSGPELRERYPQHRGVPDGHVGVWEPSAGVLDPEGADRAAVDLASAAGARVYTDTRVLALEPAEGGVIVRTALRDLRVRQAVVAAGSWTSTLIPGLPTRTYRMPICWFRPRRQAAEFALDRFPVFMRELDDGTVLWGNGADGPHPVKLGLEAGSDALPTMNPDTDDRSVFDRDWTELAARLGGALPGVEETPARVAVCMFDATPDGQFLIGRPGGDPRLVVAGGCNAHGFKHASGVGELLAQIVTGEPLFAPVPFVDPDRSHATSGRT